MAASITEDQAKAQGIKAFSHERGVVRTQFSFVATLFAAGEVPALVRKTMKSAFKFL